MFSTVSFNTIKGLTPSFPELGRIKIGMLGPERTSAKGNKFRMPEKLDHFRVTQRVRDAQGQFALDEEVHKAVGEKPTELSVTLLYDDPALNCPSRLNCFQGSRRWCHGNGEQALRMDAQGVYREQACPCALLVSPEQAVENAGKGPNELLKCKPNGGLGVQLPYKKSSIGIYRFRTTSVESIQSILTVQGAVLMRTGGILAGVPLRLRLYPATDNTPGGASKSWKVTLDLPTGGWDEIEAAAREIVTQRAASRLSMKAIEANARRQMRALVEDTDEAAKLIDELFPRPLEVIDGVEVVDEDPEGGNGHHAEGAPVVTEPQAAVEQPTAVETKPEPVDLNLQDEALFREAYNAEEEVKGDLKAAMVAKQIAVLTGLMSRKGYEEKKLKTPLVAFTRKQRLDFFQHLFEMPDAQTDLPWGK